MPNVSFLIDTQFLRQITNNSLATSQPEEKVLEVVLVYNGPDRYDTVINPRGVRTDLSTVTVDYNHNGFNTGAYLTNLRVEENYALADGTVLPEALVAEIHVPKTAEMFYRNEKGEKVSAGNLYEAIEKGFIRSVSVEFRPYIGKQLTHIPTGITYYEEWDLLRVSLLDITPGQPFSGIKIIRSFMPNLTLEDVKQALAEGSIKPEELASLLNPPAETENSTAVNLTDQIRSFLETQDNQKWLFDLLKPSIQEFVEELVQSEMQAQQNNENLEIDPQILNSFTNPANEQRESNNLQRTFHWFLDDTENMESLLRASALNNYRKRMNIYIDQDN